VQRPFVTAVKAIVQAALATRDRLSAGAISEHGLAVVRVAETSNRRWWRERDSPRMRRARSRVALEANGEKRRLVVCLT
jgi:hypothetical protein